MHRLIKNEQYRGDEVRSPYKLAGHGDPEEGPEFDYFVHVSVFLGSIITCRLYTLHLSDQAQVTLKLGTRLSDLVTRYLAGPPFMVCLTKHFSDGALTHSRRP